MKVIWNGKGTKETCMGRPAGGTHPTPRMLALRNEGKQQREFHKGLKP